MVLVVFTVALWLVGLLRVAATLLRVWVELRVAATLLRVAWELLRVADTEFRELPVWDLSFGSTTEEPLEFP